MVSRVIPVESFDLVIFGATGDLAKRKIFPGLFRRFLAGQMPTDSQVVGAARSNLSQKKFNVLVENSIKSFAEINFRDDGYIDFDKRKDVDKTIFSLYGNKIFIILILLYIFLIFSFNRIKNE